MTGRVSIAKKIPFLKLFISFATGIVTQWYVHPNHSIWIYVGGLALVILVFIFFIPFFNRFKYLYLAGVATFLLFAALGALLTFQKDIRNDPRWIGNFKHDGKIKHIVITGPTQEKAKTFKISACIEAVTDTISSEAARGNIFLYIKKPAEGESIDSSLLQLEAGDRILFRKSLQSIRNSGNPGGFDYARYCLFRGITHQAFLKPDEYVIASPEKINPLTRLINTIRKKALAILRKFIKGEKELGLAEALLIGYKDDLDPELVQSYTNTGVVHIIAISGLHIGLVYWLLAFLLKPIRKFKQARWLFPILMIAGLWLFSILAGAQPSILRSALMFTCIVIGENINRTASPFNTLAVSAFILLCINPFWLWDVGFQLSYAAVLSIMIFMRPIYNWFYIKNNVVDFIWKMNAVTIAAQVFTIPLCIYHFHQFPNYFLLSNLLAVPLSSCILFGEILLCFFSFIPVLAAFIGKIITICISFMNGFITQVEKIPGAVSDSLLISLPQTILLFIFAAATGYWLLEKVRSGWKIGLIALLGFVMLRTLSFVEANKRKRLIVYNIPQHSAIDILDDRRYLFFGDSMMKESPVLDRFHLAPSRTLARASSTDHLKDLYRQNNLIQFNGLHILQIDSTYLFKPGPIRPVIDLLIFSKNPRIYMSKLSSVFDIRQVVIDGSVPAWRSNYWKKDCDSLSIPCHDVSVSGAFVMNLR